MTTQTPPRPSPTALPTPQIPTLLASDSELYPSPLTLATLTGWIAAAPSHALDYAGAGVAVALPLALAPWRALVAGDLKEWELTPAMFVAPGARPGGVHVWHVERYPGWRREWGPFADAVRRDLRLDEGAGRWSALCVTPDGRNMCERRWNGRERAYSGQVVVDGALRERAEWEAAGAHGTLQGWAVMIVGGDDQ